MRPSVAVLSTFSLLLLRVPCASAQATTPPAAPQQATTGPNPLVEELKSPKANIRARAARDLGTSGDASTIPALADTLHDSNTKVRREVVIALAHMHQPPALDALITASRDPDEGVRVLAIRSLVGYYTGVIPGTGVTAFAKRTWRQAKGHFEADTTRLDPGVLVEPKVIAALQRDLNDAGSNRGAEEAAKGLGVLVAQTAVPDLVKAAHSSDVDLSREALNALSKIKDRSAGPPLIDLLDSPNRDVKRDASVTVGVLRADDALPKLQAIFESDTDDKDRESAIQGLAYLGQKVSVPLFTKALWNQDKVLRTSAAEGLARAQDPATLSELEKSIAAEREADVKLAIEFAISSLGKQDYLSTLVGELGSRTRGSVAQTYLIELARKPDYLPRLYPYLQSADAGVRKRLCTVLMYSGDAASLEQLDRLSHDPDGAVAAEALRAKQAIRARLGA